MRQKIIIPNCIISLEVFINPQYLEFKTNETSIIPVLKQNYSYLETPFHNSYSHTPEIRINRQYICLERGIYYVLHGCMIFSINTQKKESKLGLGILHNVIVSVVIVSRGMEIAICIYMFKQNVTKIAFHNKP